MSLWLFLALIVPFTLGGLNVLDKFIVERIVPSIYVYALWAGLFEASIGVIVLLSMSSHGLHSAAVWGGLLAGLLRSGAFYALMSALKRGQLSRVAPVIYLSPLMVAPMAAGLLGEDITSVMWGTVALAVLGAVLVSWQRAPGAGIFSQSRAQGFAFVAAIFTALAVVESKYFLEGEPFWVFFGASRLGLGIGLLAVLGMSEVRSTGLKFIGNRRFMGLMVITSALASVSVGATLGALSLGPASLVSAIGGLQPTVILMYSLVLARVSPTGFGGWITVKNLPIQTTGIAAITAAVAIISFQ